MVLEYYIGVLYYCIRVLMYFGMQLEHEGSRVFYLIIYMRVFGY